MSIYCMWIKHIAQRELLRHLQAMDASEASDKRDTCMRREHRLLVISMPGIFGERCATSDNKRGAVIRNLNSCKLPLFSWMKINKAFKIRLCLFLESLIDYCEGQLEE